MTGSLATYPALGNILAGIQSCGEPELNVPAPARYHRRYPSLFKFIVAATGSEILAGFGGRVDQGVADVGF